MCDDIIMIADNNSVHSDDTTLSDNPRICHSKKDKKHRNETNRNNETNHTSNSPNKRIQCGSCFRSFHTQAQFGQHSRICREGKAVVRHLIQVSCLFYVCLFC